MYVKIKFLIWDLIVSVPDHCLSFYFNIKGTCCHFYPYVLRIIGLKSL